VLASADDVSSMDMKSDLSTSDSFGHIPTGAQVVPSSKKEHGRARDRET
jgi:hypothetical protein